MLPAESLVMHGRRHSKWTPTHNASERLTRSPNTLILLHSYERSGKHLITLRGHCMSSATWELLIPQNDLGFNFLFVAVNNHPIWIWQVAQLVIVHAYLQKMANCQLHLPWQGSPKSCIIIVPRVTSTSILADNSGHTIITLREWVNMLFYLTQVKCELTDC